MDVTAIIWLCTLGAAVAVVTVYYNSKFPGKLVRALINIDATSPETAMSLEELKLEQSPFLKYSLRDGSSLMNIVKKNEEGKYFILPQKIPLAKSKYRSKEASLAFVFVSFLLLAVTALALTYILPDIIGGFTNQISDIFGGK